jgi:hypothetical protein
MIAVAGDVTAPGVVDHLRSTDQLIEYNTDPRRTHGFHDIESVSFNLTGAGRRSGTRHGMELAGRSKRGQPPFRRPHAGVPEKLSADAVLNI